MSALLTEAPPVGSRGSCCPLCCSRGAEVAVDSGCTIVLEENLLYLALLGEGQIEPH